MDCAVHKVPVDGSRTYITRAPNFDQFERMPHRSTFLFVPPGALRPNV
jgi:hypothetical protein